MVRCGRDPPPTPRPMPRPAVTTSAPPWRITNSADGTPAIIDIYGEIGPWGYGAERFVGELRSISASAIDVHLSSVGGDVFDGLLIYQALHDHPAAVTVYIDSLAASIASVIAQAGDRIVIAASATMMIHDAIGWCEGQAADMRQTADLLDRASDTIAAIYAARCRNGGAKTWRNRMTADGIMGTWYDATEAVAAGLADEVTKVGARNSADVAPLRRPSPETVVPAARIAACAQILDQLDAARTKAAEPDDDEESDDLEVEVEVEVDPAETDDDQGDDEMAAKKKKATDTVDDGSIAALADALEAHLTASPDAGRVCLLQAAVDALEPDRAMLDAALDLAARDSINFRPDAIRVPAAHAYAATPGHLAAALDLEHAERTRHEIARIAATGDYTPDPDRFAESIGGARRAFPVTGRSSSSQIVDQPGPDLGHFTRSLMEALSE